MKKLVFIANIASPIQVKFCAALQKHFDATFLFHEHLNRQRPDWWKIDLHDKCRILGRVVFKYRGLYLSLAVLEELRRLEPDIVLLGGFKLLSNLLAYRWAKGHGKCVVVFSESFRRKGKLRKRSASFRLLEKVYCRIDGLLSSNDEAFRQFQQLFPSFRNRTFAARYPADIAAYYNHPHRRRKEAYTYLFANRHIDIYNPLLAIQVFTAILDKHPGSVLKMNAEGNMVAESKELIRRLGIEDSVVFLSQIRTWDEMPLVYRDSDILLFPAKFSNGNFSVVEAMVSGMGIVISNKVLWNRDMIRNEWNGYTCEPELPPFVAAVENYIRCPDLLVQHCDRNREIGRKFGMEATADLYRNLLRNICYTSRHGPRANTVPPAP